MTTLGHIIGALVLLAFVAAFIAAAVLQSLRVEAWDDCTIVGEDRPGDEDYEEDWDDGREK